MLCAVAAACTVGDFARCEDTVEERGWMLLEELVDAGDVFEVDAEGDGGGEGAREGGDPVSEGGLVAAARPPGRLRRPADPKMFLASA